MSKNSALLLAATILAGSSHAALIAHYTFDTDGTDSGTSGGTAVIGTAGSITSSNFAVGTGALNLTGLPTTDTAGGDGAVSGNSFTWASDTRTVAFWMKAGTQTDLNATMISLGSGTGAGNRFDIRLASGSLRLEVQNGGTTTGTAVGDGNWYHVTVVVPSDGATVATTNYFVHDTTATLVAQGPFGGSATAINTGVGPLRIGDSYQDISRDFVGQLDDVRLYDTALVEGDAQALAALYVPEPASAALFALGALGLLRRRR